MLCYECAGTCHAMPFARMPCGCMGSFWHACQVQRLASMPCCMLSHCMPVAAGSGGGKSRTTLDVSGADKLLVLEPGSTLVLSNISLTGERGLQLSVASSMDSSQPCLVALWLCIEMPTHCPVFNSTHLSALLPRRVWPTPLGRPRWAAVGQQHTDSHGPIPLVPHHHRQPQQHGALGPMGCMNAAG